MGRCGQRLVEGIGDPVRHRPALPQQPLHVLAVIERYVALPVATGAGGISSLKIIAVTSNEPDNGLGDGDTAGDIQVTGNLTVNLRAERGGNGNGRTYTITVEAKDGQKLDGKAITAEITDAGYEVVKLETLTQSVAEVKASMKGRS